MTTNCQCKFCCQNFDFDDLTTNASPPPCKLSNVIYLITCLNCLKKYIGLTKQQLSKRVSDHRSKCKRGNYKQLIHNHFIKTCPDFDDNAKFKILEVVEEGKGESLRDRETYWINKLQTLYPIGLNVQEGKIKKNAVSNTTKMITEENGTTTTTTTTTTTVFVNGATRPKDKPTKRRKKIKDEKNHGTNDQLNLSFSRLSIY